MFSVFLTPKCPIKPPPCTSCNNNKRTELAGMHSLLALKTNPSLTMNLFLQQQQANLALIPTDMNPLGFVPDLSMRDVGIT
jgi:hypothetical protein